MRYMIFEPFLTGLSINGACTYSMLIHTVCFWALHRHEFPVGVSKYLFWPGTSWASRLTSTHHLWTIPVVMWASGGHISILCLPLSSVVILVNILLSRFFTPHSIAGMEDPRRAQHYLNLNLAHELWSDIKMPFLLVLEDQVPYLVRLFAAWSSFNAIVFWLLRLVAYSFFEPSLGCQAQS